MLVQQIIARGALDIAVLSAERLLDDDPELKKIGLSYQLVPSSQGMRISVRTLEPLPQGLLGPLLNYETRLNAMFREYSQQQFPLRQHAIGDIPRKHQMPWYLLASLFSLSEINDRNMRGIEVLTNPENGHGLLRIITDSTESSEAQRGI